MKKFSSLAVFVLVLLVAVGCASGEADTKSEISFEEIVTDIKAQMSDDLKEQTNGDVTDVSQVYFEMDLMDESGAFFMENQNISKEQLANGVVIAAMMNINSDLIILFEATDEKSAESLKEVLEREKEAQVQTWSQYLPDQYEKVKNNVITTDGNFLLYVTYSDPEKIVEVLNNSNK